jgi:hypothetical protein
MILKFRQPIFLNGKFREWHYWGFIKEGLFVGPELGKMGKYHEGAEKSQIFTGFNDKNGKEMFDGDIVRCKGKIFNKYVNLQIVMFSVDYPDCIMLISDDNHCPLDDVIEDLIVIGNVFENPELIKEMEK